MIRLSIATGLLLVSLCAPAGAEDFTFEKPHTQAEFVVTHLALSKVHGQIPLASGAATIGANGLPTAINVTFDVSNETTGNDNRDKDLREHYFEVATYPTLTFVERSVQGTPKSFKLIGDLTIHGVTKPVTLQSTVNATLVSKGKRHFAYSGTATIDRRDFGMTFGPILDGALIAGDEVTINIEADAVSVDTVSP